MSATLRPPEQGGWRRMRPAPTSDRDPMNWAILFTRARLRKGWSCQRLACEAEISLRTVVRACTTGICSSENALKLTAALGIMLVLPQTSTLTSQQAQFGR